MIKKLLLGLLGIVVLGGVIGHLVERGKPTPPPRTPEEVARDAQRGAVVRAGAQLRSMTNDPDSFRLDQALLMPDGTGCYGYRAKNALGGIVRASAVFDGKAITTSSDRSGAFQRTWDAKCAGKSGEEVTAAVR